MSVIPPTIHVHQIFGDTKPIGWEFSSSVDGGTFEFTHSVYGTFTLTGVGQAVQFPINEARAATAIGTVATYTLVANPGLEGFEETVSRGRWFVDPREVS